MPIETVHPLYIDHNAKVERCRDVIEGTDAVKGKGNTYLPKLEGQTNSEYNAYKNRASFINVSARSLSGYAGIITSKDPTLEYPPEMEPYFEDVSLTKTSFNELFKAVVDETFISGRVPLLVDKPRTPGGRAYIVQFECEQFRNWVTDTIGNLIMGVLKDSIYETDNLDEFKLVSVDNYRALRLINGVYSIETFSGSSSSPTTQVQSKGVVTPTIRGEALDFIPLTVITPQGMSYELFKPPMLDIVDVNLSHYRTSADLEQGRHWVSLPTPVVSGVEGGTTLRVGSQTAWVLPDKDAKAYYLEFIGQGLQSLEKALAEKHSQMTLFSAQLLNTSTRGSESTDVIKLRFASDAATLTSITASIEAGLNNVYKNIAKWEGYDPEEVNITLNKDFINTSLSAAEIVALTRSFIDGAIDEETYLFNLKRGELVPVGKTSLDTNIDRGNDDAT